MKSNIKLAVLATFFATMTAAQANDKEITYKVDFGGYKFSQEGAPNSHVEGGLMGIGYSLYDIKGYWGDILTMGAVTSVSSQNLSTDIRIGLATPKKVDYTRYNIGYARSLENVFVVPVSLGLSYSTDILKFRESSLGSYEKIKNDVVSVDFSIFSHKLENPYLYWSATFSVPVWKNQIYKGYDASVDVQPTGKLVVGHVFNRNLFVELSYQKQLINKQNDVTINTVTYQLPKTTTETALFSVGYVF